MSPIRQKYQALKLRVTRQAAIPESHWRALEAGARGRSDRVFRDALPVVVAEWQEAAAEQVMVWARRQADVCADQELLLSSAPNVAAYQEDIADIHRALFGGDIFSVQNNIGMFSSSLAPIFHDDAGANHLMYLSRLGDMPTHYIRWDDVATLSETARASFDAVMERQYFEPAATVHEKFKDLGVCKPLPLGKIGLMITRNGAQKGTYHASALVDGACRRPSALFHAAGDAPGF